MVLTKNCYLPNAILEKYKTIQSFIARPSARPTRYFMIKSFSERHLEISIEKGIWATQRCNEGKLNDAFLVRIVTFIALSRLINAMQDSDVILLFSVNGSGHFQGYSQMVCRIGRETSNAWNDGRGSAAWGGSFKVKWLKVYLKVALNNL